MTSLRAALLATTMALAPMAAFADTAITAAPAYKHVLLISVDGMHASDLRYLLNQPGHSTFKALAATGTVYQNAYTTAPSDSFPGMIGQVTGATPKTAGVFYDDSYDRTLFAAGSNCAGQPGTEITWFEAIDRNQNVVNAGGTLGQPLTQIDPAKLPEKLTNGVCAPILPHQFIRTNTIFEIIKRAGLRTAWADKHPAYEILEGPSGTGIDDLFTPEVNALIPGQTKDFTTSYAEIQINDGYKVSAVLNEINGLDSTGSKQVGVPAIMGLDFQSVSVGQKLAKAGYADNANLMGGYADALGTPGNALTQQLAYVDRSIGQMVAALKAQNLTDSTLIIISAKHGQSPIDRSLRVAVSDAPYTSTPGYAFHVADDEALVWLDPNTRTPATVKAATDYLKANKAALHIETILDGKSLTALYRNPLADARTPDFVTITTRGVIYTGGTKLAEHGGFSDDDRNVAMLVSAPTIKANTNYATVYTTQIAPTILTALGLDVNKLYATRTEGVTVLPNFAQ